MSRSYINGTKSSIRNMSMPVKEIFFQVTVVVVGVVAAFLDSVLCFLIPIADIDCRIAVRFDCTLSININLGCPTHLQPSGSLLKSIFGTRC